MPMNMDRSRRVASSSLQTRGYRIVTVSLPLPDAVKLDELVRQIKNSGISKITRSLVVQASLVRLHVALKGKTPSEIAKEFLPTELEHLSELYERNAREGRERLLL